MKNLSPQAQNLWAKKSNDGSMLWLPLFWHLTDTAMIAQKLWNWWVPEGVKQAVSSGVCPSENAEQLIMFLAAVHDVGKATPSFAAKPAAPPSWDMDRRIEEKLTIAGLKIKPYNEFRHPKKIPHALATQMILLQVGCNKNAATIAGAHHGKPPSHDTVIHANISSNTENFYLGQKGECAWRSVQEELIGYALELSGFSSVASVPVPNLATQVLLSGLLIMADWIASNELYFPYIRIDNPGEHFDANARAQYAWRQLALTHPWEANNEWMRADLYKERFSFKANELQSVVAKTVSTIHNPGIFVLEAPMGIGKTECALVAAEVFSNISKRAGVFFALPTQATSDGIFPRIRNWTGRLDAFEEHSIVLAHGKAQFNEDYQALKYMAGSTNVGDDDDVIVHEWFEGQKKSMLADFVVGTIDQLLFAALKQKHVMLRHLGLANKVVIIDECHAYDAYMSRYLERSLRWLGAYGVPVIVLSATLPAKKRQMVIEAYMGKEFALSSQMHQLDLFSGETTVSLAEQPKWLESREYPLITYTDGNAVKQITVPTNSVVREIEIEYLSDDTLVDLLDDLFTEDGCVGIIVNTVKRAQKLAIMLREHFGHETVTLLHSRFLAPERAKKERELLKELGKPAADTRRPEKRIVVGTQVLEQSLDFDVDVMITDICPMDLLLQRIGRLHRHERCRPKKLKTARCFILGLVDDGFEAGAKTVYGDYLLMRTKALLPKTLRLPQDISRLVQDVYDNDVELPIEPVGYKEAKEKWNALIEDKERRAELFRISPPWLDKTVNLIGWLDSDYSAADKHGEAAVRDTDESIEVLVVQTIGDRLCFLACANDKRKLYPYEIPENEVAIALARQSVRLPPELCGPRVIHKTIEELERVNMRFIPQWQKSPWLRGSLFLILDANCSTSLCGYRLTYDVNNGLLYQKEEESDA